MSYAVSGPLQTAIYQTLTADSTLGGLVGSAIYDAVPSGSVPSLYVVLGDETAQDRSDVTGRGSLHQITISVISEQAGFAMAKQTAGAVCDALESAMTLSRGTLVYLNFDRALASRSGSAGTLRRIDLRFNARVDDT